MQDNMEMVEMMREEMYTEPLGFDVIDFPGTGGGKGKSNCKTDCR